MALTIGFRADLDAEGAFVLGHIGEAESRLDGFEVLLSALGDFVCHFKFNY